ENHHGEEGRLGGVGLYGSGKPAQRDGRRWQFRLLPAECRRQVPGDLRQRRDVQLSLHHPRPDDRGGHGQLTGAEEGRTSAPPIVGPRCGVLFFRLWPRWRWSPAGRRLSPTTAPSSRTFRTTSPTSKSPPTRRSCRCFPIE